MPEPKRWLLRAAFAGAFASLAINVAADDFWLVPVRIAVDEGAMVELRGQTSSQFPLSRSAVAVDRVADARRLSATDSEALRGLSVQGRSLVLQDRPSVRGQYVIAVRIAPRSLRESAAGFRRYLELEGATAAVERVDREGLLVGRDSVTRRYAKYAKSLVQVGNGGARAFDRIAGYPLEFVPLSDPTALRAGDTLAIRLLFQGAPLRNLPVHTDVVPLDTELAAEPAAAHAEPVHAALRSDEHGVIRVVIGRAGLWSVRTVHVERAAVGSGADWDTHWASLVFGVAR